ncbi:Hypothetical predicted protein, partial [Marmota monax]
ILMDEKGVYALLVKEDALCPSSPESDFRALQLLQHLSPATPSCLLTKETLKNPRSSLRIWCTRGVSQTETSKATRTQNTTAETTPAGA